MVRPHVHPFSFTSKRVVAFAGVKRCHHHVNIPSSKNLFVSRRGRGSEPAADGYLKHEKIA
jgi:hypothetical protein